MRLFTCLTSIFLITKLKFTNRCLYTICSCPRKFWWVQCADAMAFSGSSRVLSSLLCRNVPHNFIYMKVLQEFSSIIWKECSIFNTSPHSESDIFLNPIILLNLAHCILPIPFFNISAFISPLLQYFNSI